MIEGLQPYAEYKESGQPWLGRIPIHWDLKPGHAAFAERKVPNRGLKEKTVLSLSYGRIKVKPTDKQHGLVPESYETYQIVDEGNIIIRGTDMQNDHTSLRIGLSRHRGIISSAYLCLEPRKTVIPDYGYQILNTLDLTKAIYRYGSGLRQNLNHGEIKRLPIFIPPLEEQTAIVRFLDHANRKIDGFIRAKRKLIALLGEQKQAIQEGFILDVLKNYTPVNSYYRLAKTIEGDPEFDVKKARKKLRFYVESHGKAIRDKAEIMVDHFLEQVIGQHKIGGQARAMVVTGSIQRAIEYFFAFRDYLAKLKSPYKVIVAFSGEPEFKGEKVNEAKLNGFPGNDIADRIQEDPYRFLICADKFQTGYDEPLLHTMSNSSRTTIHFAAGSRIRSSG